MPGFEKETAVPTKETLTKGLDDAREAVGNLMMKMESPKDVEHLFEDDMNDLKGKVSFLRTTISDMETRVDALPASIDEGPQMKEFEAIKERLDGMVAFVQKLMEEVLLISKPEVSAPKAKAEDTVPIPKEEVLQPVLSQQEIPATEKPVAEGESALEYFKGDKMAVREHFAKLESQFFVGNPVENSIVRLEQQNEILKDLEAGTPVVVEAYWRQGKTSMMKSLGNEWKEKNGTEPVFIDVSTRIDKWQKLSPEDFKNEFGKTVVENYVEDNFPDIAPGEMEKEMQGKTPFQALDSLMAKHGKQVLIELDEILALAKLQDGRLGLLTESLKDLKNVKVLLAWHPLDTFADQADPAFKEYKRTTIKPLSFEDTKKMIETPIKEIGSEVSFSDAAIQKIYDYAGGRPMDIKLFCAQMMGGTNMDAVQKMRYDEKDIENFINKNDLNEVHAATKGFAATCTNIPNLYNHFLNQEHKDAIALMVKAGGETSASNLSEKDAAELINLGLVLKDEKNGMYKINGELALNLFKEQVESSV